MASRPLAEAAAVWAHAPPLSVPSASDGWMASPTVPRQPTHPRVAWMAYAPVTPTEDLLDDYIPTPRGSGADGEAAVDMEGPPERAADTNCSLDLPPVYGEEQEPLVAAGNRLWQDHGEGNDEDDGWASSPGAMDYADEEAISVDDGIHGREPPGVEPVDVKPVVAHTPGVGSVDATLKQLQVVAAVEATTRYEQGPGRRVPPTPRPSEVEVALGDRRRSLLARKALKKRSAYTSRFKKVVYEELLEAELVARQARHDAVIAELDALRASVVQLRAATAAAEEKAAEDAAAQTSLLVTPAASVASTTAEPPPVGSPVTSLEPAAEGADSEADAPTTAEAPEQLPLTWPAVDKEGPGRWMLEASWADVPLPIWEGTWSAAHAA